MSLDFERAEELLGVAKRAQAALRIRLASVARAQALLALYRNDFEEARRLAQEWVDLARESGDPFDLAGALLDLGGALQVTEPTLDAAIATTEEAVLVAGAAGIDTALIFGLPMLATWLPLEESQRALALLDEAIEIATRIDARLGVAHVVGVKAWIAARRGDWPAALQGAVDAAEQALGLGDHALASRSLYTAGVALCALGSYEPAAVIFAKANTIQQRWGADSTREMLAATDTALLEALGDQQMATLTARGAALDNTDAVAYLHAEADRALAAP
jgi:tetratricopeptide (TPR) repeat protein